MAHRTALREWMILITALAVCFAGSSALAQDAMAPRVHVAIDAIRYDGTDAYTVVVSTSNASSQDMMIVFDVERFFIQTDRGWAQLPVTWHDRTDGTFLIPVAGKLDRPARITVPPTVQDLFRTYEGDLSLKFVYAYTVRSKEGAGAAFRKVDEIYCWMRPHTSQWLLREGM